MRRSMVAAGLAFVTVLGLGMLVGELRAGARPAVSPPGGIATIDIEKVFRGLTETADKDAELKAFVAKAKQEIDGLKANVDSARKGAEALPAGKERDDAMARAVELDMNEQVRERYLEVVGGRKRAQMYRTISDRISDGCKRLAQKSGYTMIISSDDAAKISDAANAEDTQRFMSLRRFLYVAPEHDVTADVVQMLNMEYTAAPKK